VGTRGGRGGPTPGDAMPPRVSRTQGSALMAAMSPFGTGDVEGGKARARSQKVAPKATPKAKSVKVQLQSPVMVKREQEGSGASSSSTTAASPHHPAVATGSVTPMSMLLQQAQDKASAAPLPAQAGGSFFAPSPVRMPPLGHASTEVIVLDDIILESKCRRRSVGKKNARKTTDDGGQKDEKTTSSTTTKTPTKWWKASTDGSVTKKSITAFQKSYIRSGHAKRLVWLGKKVMTAGGLLKRDLMCNRNGRIVSKRKSQLGQQQYLNNHLDLWTEALKSQKAQANLTGFVKPKKNGTSVERLMMRETQRVWEDAVASRVVQMMQKSPEFLTSIQKRLRKDGVQSPFMPPSLVCPVKTELLMKEELRDDSDELVLTLQ
jgi:hypothetical protein